MKISRPFWETAVKTRPKTPNGAREMTHLITNETASESSPRKLFVLSEERLRAIPKTIPQTRIPRKLPFTTAPSGLVIIFASIPPRTSKMLVWTSYPSTASIPSSGSVGVKRVQRRTAQTAAANVPIRYSTTIRPIVLPPPVTVRARDVVTRTKIRTGAIAIKAFTNSVPKVPMMVTCGITSARIIPMIIPQRIRLIKLILFHF